MYATDGGLKAVFVLSFYIIEICSYAVMSTLFISS
jgi:hypothetical protein